MKKQTKPSASSSEPPGSLRKPGTIRFKKDKTSANGNPLENGKVTTSGKAKRNAPRPKGKIRTVGNATFMMRNGQPSRGAMGTLEILENGVTSYLFFLDGDFDASTPVGTDVFYSLSSQKYTVTDAEGYTTSFNYAHKLDTEA